MSLEDDQAPAIEKEESDGSQCGEAEATEESQNEASEALLADLEEEVFWQSLQSKYPSENKMNSFGHNVRPQFNLEASL